MESDQTPLSLMKLVHYTLNENSDIVESVLLQNDKNEELQRQYILFLQRIGNDQRAFDRCIVRYNNTFERSIPYDHTRTKERKQMFQDFSDAEIQKYHDSDPRF